MDFTLEMLIGPVMFLMFLVGLVSGLLAGRAWAFRWVSRKLDKLLKDEPL